DKALRGWNVNAQNGQAARNTTAAEMTVNKVVYSVDGSLMATAANDKTVKVWDGNGNLKQTIKDLTDAMLSVAISPDNKTVAAGSY
ncbi:WD40 repeat domain-containing protein, partial [Klebsiella pneumoniae]|uniref:WD40 repeat domain-containing protein n=1 Tax=Klebsiella pneumoniae TaxID=573 RepID=UPI0027306F79